MRLLVPIVITLACLGCQPRYTGNFEEIPFGISCKKSLTYVKEYNPNFDSATNRVSYKMLWHDFQWDVAHQCDSMDSLFQIKLFHLAETEQGATERYAMLTNVFTNLYGPPSFNRSGLGDNQRSTGRKWKTPDHEVMLVLGFESSDGFIVVNIGPSYAPPSNT